MSILVVDDQPGIRLMLETGLVVGHMSVRRAPLSIQIRSVIPPKTHSPARRIGICQFYDVLPSLTSREPNPENSGAMTLIVDLHTS